MRAIELRDAAHRQHVHAVKRIGAGVIGKEVTAEHVLVVDRIVNFADRLMLVVVGQNAVLQPAARVSRLA